MIRLNLMLFFILMTYAAYSQSEDQFLSEYLEKWNNSMNYTLECLELMPTESYDYQPTEDEMNFKELGVHIMNNMVWLSTDYMGGTPFENDLKSLDPDKAQLISIMESAYQHSAAAVEKLKPHQLKQRVEFFAGEKSVRQMLELMDDHATHHRAQLAVYLRLNKIKPPRYKGW